jgi:hypothetical protein
VKGADILWYLQNITEKLSDMDTKCADIHCIASDIYRDTITTC